MPLQEQAVKVRVQQDASQILFSSVPAQRRPRHAFAARWHFDMVQDQQRNAAYDQAICKVTFLCTCIDLRHELNLI